MRKNNASTYRKISRLAALLMALLLGCCAPALAIDLIDEGAETSLTVRFAPGEVPAEGAAFALYRVADMTDFGTFTLSDGFEKYPLQVNGLDSEGWRNLTGLLADYVQIDDALTPIRTGTADAEGKCVFSGLNVGLYLVTGGEWYGETQIYKPQPALVALPSRDADDVWIYDVEISPKGEPPRPLTKIHVSKVWDDSDYSGRPDAVTVELYGNGELAETVTLNQDNNWSHTWSQLDEEISWQVVENPVPDGYTPNRAVSEVNGETHITITNYRPDDTPDDPKLPQTGLLWWPVPVLALAGMTLFLMGWMRRRGHEE